VRTGLVLEVISVGLIVVLCLAIWIHAGGVLDSNQLLLRGATGGGVLVGVVLSIAAFTGFESAGTLGMEARNPYRTIGRAILYTCIGIGIFNLVVAYTQVLGFEGTESGFAKSEAPLPDLAEIVGLSFLAPVMDIAICSSLFAGTLALINASARIAFTMAYDGMGVSALARAHAAHHTPHVAIYVAGVSVVLISIIPVLFGVNAVELTGWVATVGTFGFMLAYALVSLASPFFLRQRGAAPPLVWAVGIVGAVSMAFIFLANWLPQIIPGGLFPALTGVFAWLPYVFLAWVAIGLAWYFVVRSRDPKLAMQIGSRFESAEAGGPVSAS
jgi:amino acid transporter